MAKPEFQQRLIFADVCRIIATISVVLMHLASFHVNNTDYLFTWSWHVAGFFHSGRFCVPLFIMVSGILLLKPKPEESIFNFFKKRSTRVFIPLIIWSILYIPWKLSVSNTSHVQISELLRKAFFGEPIAYHLWFLYMILGLYVITPVLRSCVEYVPRNFQLYLLGVWLGLSAFKLLADLDLMPAFNFYSNIEIGYLGYYLAGYFLKDIILDKKGQIIVAFLFIITFFATWLGTEFLVKTRSGWVNILMDYNSFNVAVMTLCVFLLIRSIFNNPMTANPRLRNLITVTAKSTFGIYLIHPIIILLLQKINIILFIQSLITPPFAGIPLYGLAVFACSLGAVLLLKKIPVFKFIVP